MPGFLARFTNKSNAVEADLKRVTESGVIDVPQALLEPVVEAARGEDERREIMRHLQSCLAEPSGKRWKRIYAGLVLAETLVQKGPLELLEETSQGHHFDLVQRLSFLEHFEYNSDRRIQNSVRMKAKALRAELVSRLQDADDNCGSLTDTASTGSPGALSVITCSTVGCAATGGASDRESTCFSSDAPPLISERPVGQMILDGIVTVGHHDDTTSESDNDDGPRKTVQYKGSRRTSNRASRRQRSQAWAVPAHTAPAPSPIALLDM